MGSNPISGSMNDAGRWPTPGEPRFDLPPVLGVRSSRRSTGIAQTIVGTVGGGLIVAGLQNAGVLVLSGGVALVAGAIVGPSLWDRYSTRNDPPRISQIEDEIERRQWGRKQYRARGEFKPDEGAVHLILERRHGESMGFHCHVRNPEGHEETKEFAQSGKTILVRYPIDFKAARDLYEAAPAGRYKVRWRGLTQGFRRPGIRTLVRHSVRV